MANSNPFLIVVKEVHRRVHLYDAEGSEVALPFVEIESGLWDPRRRRLTLLFHPGRIKRGEGPNVALGPPLQEGRSYRFVVEAEMRDERGQGSRRRSSGSSGSSPPTRAHPDLATGT